MKTYTLPIIISALLLATSIRQAHAKDENPGCQPMIEANGELTAIILHDIFPPPIAARIYVYANIAAYEGLRLGDPELLSLTNQLKDFEAMPSPESGKEYDYRLVGLRAFYTAGKALVFSEADMEESWESMKAKYATHPSGDSITLRSIKLGEQIAATVIKRARRDKYIQTRTFPRYKYNTVPGSWNPTPPDYAEGLEPYWNRIRAVALDSSSQFMPARPIPFDTTANSAFMQQARAVYSDTTPAKTAQEIAKYWDDNPFATVYQGHFTFAIKKVTPGGHWIGITAVALLKKNSNLSDAAEAFAKVSIALFDGFIACWDEKYRSTYVRPVTVINAYIDENWKPFIQTPPFPEYTSGHSVISGASSVVLTDLFGSDFSFTDTLEMINDLPPRNFNSFAQAAEEASISRFYGGIHYKATLSTSLEQGRNLGAYINERIRLRRKK